MKLKDITKSLQEWAPLPFQESYDNSGLIVGDEEMLIEGCLISLDLTESVIEEALKNQCNMIISHHPIVFKGIKKLSGNHWVNRCLIKAIKNDLAIYAIHTNLDNVMHGVNGMIAHRLKLTHGKVLRPMTNALHKLVTFVPIEYKSKILKALHQAGAGDIGNYKECSFNITGEGVFKPAAGANPTLGSLDKLESVKESRIEVILPRHKKDIILSALKSAHPYEEVPYYLTSLENNQENLGAGLIGHLPNPMPIMDFLGHLKLSMGLKHIRHTPLISKKVERIAVCGGSGSFLLNDACALGADIFISADFKYHDFFEADSRIIIADIGHYESEVFTKQLLCDFLNEKFTNIAFRLSKVNTNPINYF
ncbi:MAG: Nif3-like dinuclear metal center hexameric protein [Flammeovirgaceae bacterium TMED32]|nr:MAG: Nif3-like dinuclear metal center hexameric protein [Flammeovirgaceae bacterium TMED32]